jgi:tetratricopeptide (TPR) repeat protein
VLLALGLGVAATLVRDGPDPDSLAIAIPGVALLAAFAAIEGIPARARFPAVALVLLVGVVGSADAIAARWARTPLDRAEDWIRTNVPPGAPVLIEADAVEEKTYFEGETHQVLELPARGSEGTEASLYYDPAYTRYFPWTVLRDLTESERRAADDPTLTRAAVHAWMQEAWNAAARFDSGRSRASGVTIFARPADLALEDESIRSIASRFEGSDLTAVRDTSRTLGDWLVRGGSILRSIGELEGARAFLQPAVARDSTNVEAQYQLGLVYLIAELDEQAKARFLVGMFYDPAHGGLHFNLAVLLEKEEDFEGAETEYRAAILLLEDPVPAHARLGALLARTGDYAGALEELTIIRQLAPGGEADTFLAELLGNP